MILLRGCVLVALACLLAACRDEKPAQRDSTAVMPPALSPVGVIAPNTGWDEATAGPAMLLSISDNSAAAWVVLPFLSDSTIESADLDLDSLSEKPVELFSRRGLSGATVLVSRPDSVQREGCLTWPQAGLAEIPSDHWRVGFVRGIVAPLPLDSLEAMRASDSSGVTTELARLSSALAEGDDPAFRGLPFTVRKAYRFTLGETTVLAGDVVRRIPEEANPREEHLLVVAEKPSTGTSSYSAVFHSRVAGAEDAVRTNEILAAVRFVKSSRPALVIAFDYEDGGRVALLQRISPREWRITWRSAYTGC